MMVNVAPQSGRPSTPQVKAPAGSCDCHAHIFGPADRYPYAEGRDYTPPDASREDYLAMLSSLGIERMVIVQPSVLGFDNRCTTDAVAAFGTHRARSVVMVPRNIDSAALQELHDGGARGVRFITTSRGGAPLEQIREIATLVAPLGWHVQAYIPAQKWADLEQTVRDLPVEVVMDHMAGIKAEEAETSPGHAAVLRLLETGRCWVKLSGYRSSNQGPPWADVAPLARRLAERFPERCVWGTDWPHPNLESTMPDDGQLLDLLHEWIPDGSRRKAVLVHNPARLYGFTERTPR